MTDTFSPGLQWRVIDFSHSVDYRQFSIVEDGSDDPDLAEDGPQEPEWFASGDGWLAVLSGGSLHQPSITLEAWDREPPTEERPWAESREAEVIFTEETLRIWGTASGPSRGPRFVLPESVSEQYRVRVYRSSESGSDTVSDQVIAMVDDGEHEDGIYGLEEWLFQFWPCS